MLAQLAFSLFCIVSSAGAPDSALIGTRTQLKLPFANVDVPFVGFLIVAPFMLLVLTLYLHIFNNVRLAYERDRGLPEARTPALFTLRGSLAAALTTFIFFWAPPIVLGLTTWKALGQLHLGLPLLFVTAGATVVLVSMQIRRRGGPNRFWWNLPLWMVLACIISLVAAAAFTPTSFLRRLDLFRADLKGEWLEGLDLRGANLSFASLQGSKLGGAQLTGADFRGALLGGADLTRADLSDAKLTEADLTGTMLSNARLAGATLARATLIGARMLDVDGPYANFDGAELTGADLSSADLRFAQFNGSKLNGADAKSAIMVGAELIGATLVGANIKGADLTASNLTLAQLQGVLAQDVVLIAAVLVGTNLAGADLARANLRGAYLKNVHVWRTLTSQINLRSARILNLYFGAPPQTDLTSLFSQGSIGDKKLADIRLRLDSLPARSRTTGGWNKSVDRAIWNKAMSVIVDPSSMSRDLGELACLDKETARAIVDRRVIGTSPRASKVLELIPAGLEELALVGPPEWDGGDDLNLEAFVVAIKQCGRFDELASVSAATLDRILAYDGADLTSVAPAGPKN